MKKLELQSYDHITLIVADIERSRQFYVEKLGMEEVSRPDFDFDGAWFQTGNVQIHITIQGAEAGEAGWGDRGNSIPSRGHHFAFRVNDCHAESKKLADLGIPVVQGPKERPDGAVQVYFEDPDGHLVELVSG